MGPNILIVDDTVFNRRIMRDILKRHIEGGIFFEAENGKKALEIIKEESIDLIILDLMMPVMDGFSFLLNIQANEQHKDIPVIVFSAADEIESIQRALEMGVYDYVTRPLSKEQTDVVLPLKVRNALKSYEQKKALVKANEDLSREMELIRHLGCHDGLTGIYNRMFFDQEMERINKDRERYPVISIMVIDLDGVKMVNDILGHTTGDELLKCAAEIIRKPFRKGDIIARLGGDEFGVLLPGVDQETCNQKKREILEAVEAYNTGNPYVPISMSIGCATSLDASERLHQIFHRADQKMYEHKLNAKGHYHKKMADILITALLRNEDLEGKQALEKIDGMMERLRITKDEVKNILQRKNINNLYQ
ncbi:diguanylate cyclase (GGDEF) domain-containing protein [Geosporobacter subterraneus DSM 17957]|uniref:Stage 0 sporulation protein A homolog n=1 Tax=Geosporobacter subterraneus DSM 17957 TaxID=1121919 RepID=A0A1M6ETE9_9FIRM|nr:diguanylate cyclase [Geosporobacter subterraneus]SHI88747.1 diguanylate cyclase (GGDEF) domain-containing protein [Geosporobacter subterraneus DSM 17957]